MPRLKVLQFIASTKWGGMEKVFVDLANQLAKECDLYAVLLRGTDYVERFGPEVKLVMTSIQGSRRNLFLLFELARIIKGIQPDIVHTHGSKASEMIHTIGRFQKILQVATKHNARKGRIFDRVPWVTAVSSQVLATVHNPGNAEVIYNGIIPQDPAKREKIQPFTIIAVGRLDEYKGFDTLVREVRKLSFAFVLHIVGEGEERKNLENLVRQLHLEKNVFLPGHREDIPGLLGQAHLQVISSRTEGFGLVVAEGLFYSDVLLARKVGIAPEILTEELLVTDYDFAAKITEIHDNYEYFKELFSRIKMNHSHRFLLPDIAGNYLNFYDRMMQSA